MAKKTEAQSTVPVTTQPATPTPTLGVMGPSAIANLQALRQALATKYLERSELVDCMLVALISGEPLIMIGPPGTAKSGICRDICTAINGKPFIWTLTKFTVPEELYGPLSLRGLEQDRYTRVMTGKLPEADVVLLNEIGKASSSISNTLLDVMNEREFFNDGKPTPIPMLTLYGTSNEVPQAEELGAFYDRFVLRCFVDYVKEETSARALFQGLSKVSFPAMSLQDVMDLRAAANAMPMSTTIVDLLIKIRRACEKESIMVSDRKWCQIVNIVRGMAVLDGRAQVEEEDLGILTHILWSDPDQIPAVKKLLAAIVNPVGQQITAILDGVAGLQGLDTSETNPDVLMETYKKIDHAKKSLEKIGDPAKNPRVKAAFDKVESQRLVVAKKVFG